ncbi:MAG TPA: DUF5335 family protein [Terriglobia bacterium]|nr:DUF5335 family protein [Terriglobia bacterium]
MKKSKYIANLSRGNRVYLIGLGHHPKRGDECTIIRILPNPSQNPEHQWYDVRFEDGTYGRFLEKYLAETREIPAQEWRDFFESFSHRHQDWLVFMETFDRDTADQTASRVIRLKSISAEGPMIIVVGEDDMNEVSQLVRAPARVLLTKSKAGADEGIEIDSDKSLLVLRFRAPVLPEVVDGVA